MSWCSNCKTEYKEYITTCPDCGQKLIDYEPKEKVSIDTIVAMEPELLISTSNQTEESMIVSLLEDANISVLVKNCGIGGYMKIYMGYSVYGSDIYVDKNDFLKAKEILDSNLAESNCEVLETEIDVEAETNVVTETNVVAETEVGTETDIVTEKDSDHIKVYPISRQWAARLILLGMLLTLVIAFVLNNFF